MENFDFVCSTKIIFGKGTEARVGEEVKNFAKKVLLHYGGGSIKESGLYDKVIKSLKDAGVEFVELGGVKPNPRITLVEEGVKLCRDNDVEFILAVGGGSVIDSAKAISAGVFYEGDNIWDICQGPLKHDKFLPIGTILTIPAAGSEASKFAVISNDETGEKTDVGVGHELLRPVFSILNPELTYTLPDYQTACGCVDILMHTLERYFTNVTDVDLTDRLCEGLLISMMDKTARILKDPKNYALRAEIMWTGTISHNGLLDTGRVSDFASHMIEHQLSAKYDIAHGAGLAIIFPSWARYVMDCNIMRFAQFANRVMGVEMDFEDPKRTALEGIQRVEDLFRAIGMPVRLSEIGIGTEHFDEMAKKCTNNDAKWVGNLKKLYADDVKQIFELAK